MRENISIVTSDVTKIFFLKTEKTKTLTLETKTKTLTLETRDQDIKIRSRDGLEPRHVLETSHDH